MPPYVAAVLPSRDDEAVKVKVYLPIDTMKYLDNSTQDWVWDTQTNEIVDAFSTSTQSMHDLLPSLPVARQTGPNTWDLRHVN